MLGAFVHPQARDAHLAVRAFNVDVARIEDQVSSVAIGRLRMQFWRDAVERAFSGVSSGGGGQPAVAVLLQKVLRDDGAPLSRLFFQRVISSRVGGAVCLFVCSGGGEEGGEGGRGGNMIYGGDTARC